MATQSSDTEKKLVGFYGISTLVGYFMLNPAYTYISYI